MLTAFRRTRTRAVRQLQQSDPRLQALIDRVGRCTWEPEPLTSVLEALTRSIVYQQLTGKAAATIHRRVLALFPRSRLPAAATLAATPPPTLRSAGLSASKVAAVLDLAARIAARQLPTAAQLPGLSDEAIIDALTTVRGIGRWSVEMLLIFRLGRMNVWPIHDYGVRKGYARIFGGDLPLPKYLAAAGDTWHPYRSVASWYLWRANDL